MTELRNEEISKFIHYVRQIDSEKSRKAREYEKFLTFQDMPNISESSSAGKCDQMLEMKRNFSCENVFEQSFISVLECMLDACQQVQNVHVLHFSAQLFSLQRYQHEITVPNWNRTSANRKYTNTYKADSNTSVFNEYTRKQHTDAL